MATIKDIAKAARVSTATVSAVVNGSAYVSPELRARVEKAVRAMGYQPSRAARTLRRGRSELIAVSVADLNNPFYARILRAAEACASARGYAIVVFNSDENRDAEARILKRVQALGCDGLIMVPVGAPGEYVEGELTSAPPKVLLGRAIEGEDVDSVVIDNISAGRQATDYLLDLGHRRIGTITGRLGISTGRGRLDGMVAAMRARGCALLDADIRHGEFREEVAYSAALDLLRSPDRPTALYVANGVMALGVMRAVIDLGLRCPQDISIASTDTIAGHGGVSPRLTRTEHPVAEMTTEAVRLLIERIDGNAPAKPRTMVFAPALVVGDSCAPLR
jgi:LacI family transcriptional regulator